MTARSEARARALVAPEPFVPLLYRVSRRREETSDVISFALEPLDGDELAPLPGQFVMLSAFGVGEVAISVSGTPARDGALWHTVRAVGPVTAALCAAPVGALVGVRGPFGTHWGLEGARGADAVVVAGGIGIAPLRSLVGALLDQARPASRHVAVLVGARSPGQIVLRDDLTAWRAAGAYVATTVDAATPSWAGSVGVVTALLGDAPFDPAATRAFICGPEVMMRLSARALTESGVAPEHIELALERNMACGIGLCGHCQLGPLLLCRDGPVVGYDAVAGLLAERER